MTHSSEKSSAELQREIDRDRERIGARIDAIQERMSPGQLVDEVIAYAKGSGGADYLTNLGKAVKANPLPVALMGVSLAWLVAKQGTSTQTPGADDSEVRPLYPARGTIKRIGPPEEIGGVRYSHFTDESGERFKALTDETGRRAGDFLNATGKAYRGFSDAAGERISAIRDEAGSVLDASLGWASDTWSSVKGTVGGAAETVDQVAGSVSNTASSTGTVLKEQSSRLNNAILSHFRDQPLVGGALAFAVGAAIGAALPHSQHEDELLGEASDAVKANAASRAGDAVNQSMDVASDMLDKAVSVTADVHDAAKERIDKEIDALKNRDAAG
ncbi:uncharacterized protein YjbJ (UPF0337 family) [Rhizobium sp. BK650]|uniref:DUF3618 domain-containing protein n=1 Tax=Rhizobium sp. BK650 TaxID=2586990 RepID=UPI001614C073|nr:DUF3618 domain-containing protein [Rhizobium sp. BK650]MBB3660757.1 uncharacterized protein YjbJ (UPF0337 family) [Rhizobium sp. BK650]